MAFKHRDEARRGHQIILNCRIRIPETIWICSRACRGEHSRSMDHFSSPQTMAVPGRVPVVGMAAGPAFVLSSWLYFLLYWCTQGLWLTAKMQYTDSLKRTSEHQPHTTYTPEVPS